MIGSAFYSGDNVLTDFDVFSAELHELVFELGRRIFASTMLGIENLFDLLHSSPFRVMFSLYECKNKSI